MTDRIDRTAGQSGVSGGMSAAREPAPGPAPGASNVCGPERVGSDIGTNSLTLRATVATLRELSPEIIGRVVQECDFVRDRGEVLAIAAAIADALEDEPAAPRPRPVCQSLRPGCDFPDCPCGAP